MGVCYWLNLFGIILLLVLSGAFTKSAVAFGGLEGLYQACGGGEVARPLLCGHKIYIKKANITQLAMIDGISLARARKIRDFFQAHPGTYVKFHPRDLGIGPKLFERLKEKFEL